MKPKKSPKADLRRRRILFFEIGAITALAFAILAFSLGQTEKTVKNYSETFVEPPIPLPPVTPPDKPKTKMKPLAFNATVINVRPNTAVIDNNEEFPDFGECKIPIPEVNEKEHATDLPPVWVAEEMPLFNGGDLNEFRKWVFSQIEYPALALQNEIQGRVSVKFVIERDGSLSNIEVLYSPDRTLADETVRVLKTSPKWTPGKQRNKPVRVYYVLPVDYQIGY